ncbi:unnamed protein product [Lampetra planeri]
MAQKKKKLTKKKRHGGGREPQADSDSGEFEVAAEIMDDDSSSLIFLFFTADNPSDFGRQGRGCYGEDGQRKTAAFLIPMFERLKAPQAQTGARALILTPTRELALQTMKFTKEVT